MPALTPSERTLRARSAAYAKAARYDGTAATAAARAAGPGSIDYWLQQLPADADDLPDAERIRRAEALKKAHFTKLAYLSARARRRR